MAKKAKKSKWMDNFRFAKREKREQEPYIAPNDKKGKSGKYPKAKRTHLSAKRASEFKDLVKGE